jgi:hypothetical protein
VIGVIDAFMDRFGVERISVTLGATEGGSITSRGFRVAKGAQCQVEMFEMSYALVKFSAFTRRIMRSVEFVKCVHRCVERAEESAEARWEG